MASDTFHLSTYLPYRLAVLSERVSHRLFLEYDAAHGFSVAEWRVLVHLSRCGTVSIRDIHNCVNLEKPRVSRAVTRMEKDGLVQKVPGKVDARLVAISLTKKGKAALEDILPRALDIEARLCANVDEDDLSTFYRVMEQFHEVLDDDPKAKVRSRLDIEHTSVSAE